MNKLTYSGKVYDDKTEVGDKLMSASAHICDSLPAVQLSVDTLTAVVRDYSLQPRLLAAEGVLLAADGTLLAARLTNAGIDQTQKYGEDVLYHHNDELIGKFKLESIKRVGRYAYQLNCLSAVGLLLTSDHFGGIYTGQSAAQVMAEIVGGVVSYTLDAALADVPVYGWLPKAKRRDNLRDLLFAIGGQIRKDTAGELHMVPMTAGDPYTITVDEFYMGGSVTGGNPATGIDLTEHSFMALPGDQTATLYDGEAAAEELVTPQGATLEGVLVEFQQPCHSLSIENGQILESGANYAVISQSPSALLTGKQYTHVERIISRRSGAGTVPNIIPSKACTLVNLMNAELVADRLMAYYGSAKTIVADIVVTDQKPGDAVTFTDPFGDPTTGYIADMDLTMSAILKARATLISGFIPTSSGNYYSNVMVVTKSGTITIPEDCKGKIRRVLIGGGDGGTMGTAGAPGGQGSIGSATDGAGGEGGQPGTPGASGKVFVDTIRVTPGQQFYVQIGAAGRGQTASSAATRGGATTMGEASSADGFSTAAGYAALLTDEVFALPGEEGIPGGRGSGSQGVGPNVEYKGQICTPGPDGADSGTGNGGHGGGAAAGANGGAGSQGDFPDSGDGGRGGTGATPVKPPTPETPGQGGGAGHGGGGGGGGGGGASWPGPAGPGGAAGPAGDGAPGVLLIYY